MPASRFLAAKRATRRPAMLVATTEKNPARGEGEELHRTAVVADEDLLEWI